MMTTPTKEQILFNLATAHEYLSEVPEKAFDLDYFREDRGCGTLFCAAGHLTRHPHFAQFMKLVPETRKGWALRSVQDEVDSVDYYGWLDEHFGPDAFDNCFAAREGSERDADHPRAEFGYVPNDVSDKALALWRLEQQIECVKGGA